MSKSIYLVFFLLCLTARIQAQSNDYDFVDASLVYRSHKTLDLGLWEPPAFDYDTRCSTGSRAIALQRAIEELMASGNYTTAALFRLLHHFIGAQALGDHQTTNRTNIDPEWVDQLIQQYGQGSSKSRSSSGKQSTSTTQKASPSKERKSTSVMVNSQKITIVATANENAEENLQIVQKAIGLFIAGQKTEVGQGASSYIYKVVIEDKAYVVKKSKPGYRRALITEAEQALDLQHPNVIGLAGYGISTNSAFLVMEFFSTDLWDKLFKKAEVYTPSIEQSFNWLRQIIYAINYLHSLGWVHDDLKLENIFLREDDSLVIADLGFMGKNGQPRARPKKWRTPVCTDPHTENPNMTFAADIWALGIVASLILNPETMGSTLYRKDNESKRVHPSIIGDKTTAIAQNADVIGEFHSVLGLDMKGIKNDADLPGLPQWLTLSKAAVLHAIVNFTLRQVPSLRPTANQLQDIINTHAGHHSSI